jgi:NTP pyrophosphatase (non-canonical NTP hydrolase)
MVSVERTEFTLSEEALEIFEAIHDNWELNICEKYQHDPLIGGTFTSC